ATAADAKGLMRAALREPSPVLFHRVNGLGLQRGSVPQAEDFLVPIGSAVVRREGTHATLLTYGSMVEPTLSAADALEIEGLQLEVIDLRTLVPIDWLRVLESVHKTKRAMVVHEAMRTAGPGAEIAAHIQEEAFYDLEMPVFRVAGKGLPLLQHGALEVLCIPSVEEIVAAARYLCCR
ncbi:MAG: transketolase C-terminal domain-containing protein, partial [Parahaliea sp.]